LIRLDARLAEKANSAAVSFDEDENAQWQTRFLIDRLAARFGDHRVLRFVPQDTHIPEAAGVVVPAQDRDVDKEVWAPKRTLEDPPRRPLRLLQKPEEIRVSFPEAPDGPPAFFHWRQCRHDVLRAEGPERIALEWWRSVNEARSDSVRASGPNIPGPTRDYFRVETRQGQRFWLYRDGQFRRSGLQPRWYLQGIFA
jgi:protein ImuB